LSDLAENAAELVNRLPTRRKAARVSKRTTPKILEFAFIAIVGFALIAYFAAAAAIGRFETAAVRIGYEAKPAAVIAQKLSVTLADMDAQITDSSLGNGQSWSRYTADIATAVTMVTQAERMVGDDDPEADALRNIQLQLRNYYQLVGGSSVTSPDIFVSNEQLARTTTLWASRTLRQDIIAQAQNAAELASRKLVDAYAEFQGDRGFSAVLAVLPLILLLAALIVTQAFLTRRTHRLINVPLLISTLGLVVFIGWFIYVAETGRAAILVAKETAFDDLQTLYRAKVTAYLMKADESMWLFELRKARFEQRRLRGFYAKSFSDSARQLIDIANVAQFPVAVVEEASFTDPIDHATLDTVQLSLDAAAKSREAGRIEEATKSMPRIPGILGDELRRFGSAGTEWKASYEAVSYLLRYLEIDRRIRNTALGESRDKAVQLSIGGGEGGADWAFSRMDAALDRMIATDDASFDSRLGTAIGNLTTLAPLLAGILLIVTLLSGFGLWQRYREYR
jgi:hypothetical protein